MKNIQKQGNKNIKKQQKIHAFLLTSLCWAKLDVANLCRTLLNVTFVQSVHWLAKVQLDFAPDVAPIDSDSIFGNVTVLLSF